MGYSPPPPPPPQGWWSKNWKWFVPTLGCVGCVLPLVLFGGCIAAIFTGVTGAVKSSAVYTQALDKAKSHPAVIAQLGQPIEQKGLIQGSINNSNGVVDANIRVPIAGSKGTGTLHAVGTARGNAVDFSTLTVTVAGGGSINLLDAEQQQDFGDPASRAP